MQETVIVPGHKAPQFAFQTDDGRNISRDDFGGKLLVLNFWATWCQGCVEEMPSLDSFAAEMRNEGVVVATVSVDRNEQAYRRFVQQLRPRFLTMRDPESELAASFGTFRFPETYVIDRSGRVRQKYVSYRNWTDGAIVSEVRKLLLD